jgi:hypothetical protein
MLSSLSLLWLRVEIRIAKEDQPNTKTLTFIASYFMNLGLEGEKDSFSNCVDAL